MGGWRVLFILSLDPRGEGGRLQAQSLLKWQENAVLQIMKTLVMAKIEYEAN